MDGPVESEIKLRVDGPPDPVREALAGLGATPVRPRHFEDNALYDDEEGSLFASGCALRIRTTDRGGVLTYKGPREIVEGVRSRPEHETTVGDPAVLHTVLGALGYRPRFRYQKYREVWRLGEVEVVVDETPIGLFVEIEGPIEAIHRAARALGRGPDDYVTDSYASLFWAGGGQGDMVFPDPA